MFPKYPSICHLILVKCASDALDVSQKRVLRFGCLQSSFAPDYKSECGFGFFSDPSAVRPTSSTAQIAVGIALIERGITVSMFWVLTNFWTLFPMLGLRFLNVTFDLTHRASLAAMPKIILHIEVYGCRTAVPAPDDCTKTHVCYCNERIIFSATCTIDVRGLSFS